MLIRQVLLKVSQKIFFDKVTLCSAGYFHIVQQADQLDTLSLFYMESVHPQFAARYITSEKSWPSSNISFLF